MQAQRHIDLKSTLGLIALYAAAISTTGAQTPATAQQDAAHPGKVVYDRTCGACHNNPQATRAPGLESLRILNRPTVEYAINVGYMKMQAKDLNSAQRKDLLDWLSMGQTNNAGWVTAAMCKGKAAAIDTSVKPTASTFGLGPRNLRHLTSAQTGLKTADFAKMELKWAFALPQTPTMRSQPVVAGNTIYVASADSGRLFALDTESGCLKWQYETPLPLRSSLTYTEIEKGKPVILVGDAVGAVVMIDAKTGKLVWRTSVAFHEAHRVTGAPVVAKGKVFAPLSAVEINYTSVDTYECCKAQGAVVALDLKTGKQLWIGRTMEPATKQKLNRAGAQLWGPSGAPIWNTPAIDEKRNVLYVGTGENNSLPATNTSDAIMAFDLDTGERKWVFQATQKDVWNYACRRGANCDFGDAAVVVDHDFGGSVMIAQRKDGRDLIVVGQKSGTTWALDPDNKGALVWSRKIGSGGANGGIHWGTATDGTRVYVSLNDRSPAPESARVATEGPGAPEGPLGVSRTPGSPGLFALDLETGDIVWGRKAEGDCSGDRKQRFAGCDTRLGYSPAPLIVDGAVVQGSVDGILRVFDAATGKTLWSYDTMRKFETVNGVPGNGGSIDSSPYIAANGMLFSVSGYARFGETPGNVLLAFKPKK